MSRTFSINGTDRTSKIRLADFQFTECANQGEVGIGGFTLTDAAAQSYYSTAIALGPDSYWRLSETSSTFGDSVGSVVGTVVGSMTRGYTPGALDPADTDAAVDLTGGRITFGDNYDFAGTAAFSVVGWIYLDTLSGTPIVLGKVTGGVGWQAIISSGTSTMQLQRANAGTDAAPVTGIVTGAWLHVAVTYDGTTMYAYVNGVQGTGVASSRSLPGNAVNLTMGANPTGGATTLVDGRIDEVGVWSRALTADSVLRLYQSAQSTAIDVPAMKAITADESSASTTRMFTGYTHERTTQRGVAKVLTERDWDVEVVDINTLALDYRVSGTGAKRPAETDYERVTWLLTQDFGTSGGVSAGVVPNTNTADMDAEDLRGKTAADILNECAEMAGKQWFIYRYSSGPLLYYDLSTGTSLSSTAKISDINADVDSSTTWAAGPISVRRSPDRIYSTVRFKYKRGTVIVTNATTESNYRHREIAVLDLSVKTSTKATNKANKFLAAAATEKVTISDLSIAMPAANVNDIRAGQRIQIKLSRHGIVNWTYYRVLRRTVRPLPGTKGVSDVDYLVTLTLTDSVLPTIFQVGRGGDQVWEEKSNATEDAASVIMDEDGITIYDSLDASTVMSASGFSGAWADFIRLGLYNARFTQADTGGIASGRTSDLPYWTVDFNSTTGALTGLTGGGIKGTFGALNDEANITSDNVPVRPGSTVEVGASFLVNRAAGTLTLNGWIYWYKADGTASATANTAFSSESFTSSVSTLRWILDTLVVPTDAVTAHMRLQVKETVSHNAANYISLYGAKLIDQPLPIPPGVFIADSGIPSVVTPSGTSDDYDPGSINTTTFLRADPTANWTLRGLLAPYIKWKTVYLYNQGGGAAYTITLKNDDAGSTAANRFYTPSSADFVLAPLSGCLLLYSTTLSRWLVIA